MPIGRAILVLFLACLSSAFAQEVKRIDLTAEPQRTTLRIPVEPAPRCETGKSCIGGGLVGGSVADGAADIRDVRSLGIYLLSVTPTDIDPTHPFEAEFRVLNTGLVPIQLPVGPHLSDLQPGDESAEFTYMSLSLVVHPEDTAGGWFPGLGIAELYGSQEHSGSILTLKPGQWISVNAQLKFHTWPSPLPIEARLQAQFWLRRNTFHPHPGGSFTETANIYPNATPTPGIAVRFVSPPDDKEPK